ncbi:hypothetical protein IFM89_038959 [Coptis chinensis]|uniref:Retrotransposon Copia-like N-terminal domain-containing protein n=1 Tax=Coptis chinensis TaxID=261450 RepID=A0A835MK86_9MAGN|nr:hypothetical protein IFM89_038959 [Coptis chinensis]
MDTLGESYVSVQGHQATTTLQSITSERLNGINFKTWSRSVVHYLTSKGAEGLVDGTYACPAVTDEKKYTQWKKHNTGDGIVEGATLGELNELEGRSTIAAIGLFPWPLPEDDD